MTDIQDGLFDNPPPPILCGHTSCGKEIAYRPLGNFGRYRWIHVRSNMSQCDDTGTQWARPGKDTVCSRCDKPMPQNYCWNQYRVRGECPLGFMARDIAEGKSPEVVVMTPQEYIDSTQSRRGARADQDQAAHARRTDPITSHEAAASIKSEELRRSQLAVLAMFQRFGPMHDVALVERYESNALGLAKQSPSGIRTRRSELVVQGVLEDSGQKVVLESGRRAIVWRVFKP